MNVLMTVLITLNASSAQASTPQRDVQLREAHPFERVLRNLGATAVEVESSMDSLKEEEELKKELAQVRNQLSLLSRRAALAPVEIADSKIKSAGFEFRIDDRGLHSVQTNAAIEQIKKSAYRFEKGPATALLKNADQESSEISALIKTLKVPIVQSAFTNEHLKSVLRIANNSRLQAVEAVKTNVQLTLSCIQYFSEAYSKHGLQPLTLASGQVNWSPDLLSNKYKVHSLADLSAAEKKSVKTALEELIFKVEQFESTCIPLEHGAFIEKELDRLNSK